MTMEKLAPVRINDCPPANRFQLPAVTHGHEVQTTSGQTPVVRRWYCLRTMSRFEFAVGDALDAAGIEHFLPTRQETTRWTDRTAKVTRPLFTGYIFARFVPANASTILQTRGVVQILTIDQQPAPISDDEIASIRAVVDSPAAFERVPYVAGSTVRVERGPFAGVFGVVTRTQGATTLTIPVTILGRAVSVQIDAADVSAVPIS